jgi:hypothetical protein
MKCHPVVGWHCSSLTAKSGASLNFLLNFTNVQQSACFEINHPASKCALFDAWGTVRKEANSEILL